MAKNKKIKNAEHEVEMTSGYCALIDESATTIDEPATTTNEPTTAITDGYVTGCAKLNVRSDFDVNSKSLCVIPVGSKLVIDLAKSVYDWYYVCTESGVEGFCMAKYITLGKEV